MIKHVEAKQKCTNPQKIKYLVKTLWKISKKKTKQNFTELFSKFQGFIRRAITNIAAFI